MVVSPVDSGKGRDSLNGTDSDATATATLVTGSSVTLSDDETSSDSASDSSDESDESTSEEDSDDDDDLSPEYMASLLEKARANARAKQLEKEASEVAFANDEDVIKIAQDDKLYEDIALTKHTYQSELRPKLPSLHLNSLPPSYFEPSSQGAGPSKFRNPEIERALEHSAHLSAPAPPEAPHTKLSKKQRQAVST
jgi:hypothetical protein